MALVNVDEAGRGPAKKANDMEVGETISGYPIAVVTTQHGPNLRIQPADGGENYLLFCTKDLQYKIGDGKIRLGQYTEITKLTNKKGTDRATFQVLQDSDRTVEVNESELTIAGITSDAATPIKSAVAAKAAKLAAQIK